MKSACILALAVVTLCSVALGDVGTSFNYQGRFKDGSGYADGTYEFGFKLYDALSGGDQKGNTVTKTGVEVEDGFFAVDLDFGSQFDGTSRWLQIGIKQGGGTYTTLTPRQEIKPMPYSMLGGNTVGNNTVLGKNALSQVTTGGDYNTAIGIDAMGEATSAAYNTAVGIAALKKNVDIRHNVAVGYAALMNFTGNGNIHENGSVAVGGSAMTNVTTGSSNVGVGRNALYYNVVGHNNVAVGSRSLESNTGGNSTAVGTESLLTQSSGNHNAAFGYWAGRSVTTGVGNTFIGPHAGYNGQKADAVNSTAIGNSVVTTADNQVVIGNIAVTQTLLRGNVGIGTTSPQEKLDVSGNVQCVDVIETSDAQLKGDIEPLTGVLDKLAGVRSVSFQWNAQARAAGIEATGRQIGVLAQEVEAAFPELVRVPKDVGPLSDHLRGIPDDAAHAAQRRNIEESYRRAQYRGVSYGKLTAVLLEAVKELKSENDDLKQRLADLEQRVGK